MTTTKALTQIALESTVIVATITAILYLLGAPIKDFLFKAGGLAIAVGSAAIIIKPYSD
jgi:hypothetical protein